MKTQTVSYSAVIACGLLLVATSLLTTLPGRRSNAQNEPSPHASNSSGLDADKPPLAPALTETTTRYRVTDLGTLGGSISIAYGINNKGQIVGKSFDRRHTSIRAFLYERGKMTDLGRLLGYDASEATGINNQGVIVGSIIRGFDAITYLPFVYQQGKMEEIKVAASHWLHIFAVNDAGLYAGTSQFNGYIHACLYRAAIQDLGTLEGDKGWSAAYGINARGQVVGSSRIAGDTDAVLFTDGKIVDLGVLPEPYAFDSEAHGINSLGDIVGWSGKELKWPPKCHAFLYRNHNMVDLNTLLPADSGWVLAEANGINDSGQIVGYGMYRGKHRAFLLSPLDIKQHTIDPSNKPSTK